MPPKRSHSDSQNGNSGRVTSPQVVLRPFLRDDSSRRKHCFSSLPASASLFNKPDLSDIRLHIQPTGQVFHAHRNILSAASDVFLAMLQGPWADSRLDDLDLHEESDDCARIFELFLYFIYSGSIAIRDDYVVPLFLLAGKYDVRTLADECAKLIERALHVYVVIDPNAATTDMNPVRHELTDASSSSSSSSSESSQSDVDEMSDNDGNNLGALQWGQEGHPPHPIAAPVPSDMIPASDSESSPPGRQASSSSHRLCRTRMIASETFTVSVVLRLLDRCHGHDRVRRAALLNLEARVGNQISQGNVSSTVWLDLELDVIMAMLSDSRFGYSELCLFKAAEAWLMHHTERLESPVMCSAVLKCIRYPLLSIDELYDVQKNAVVKSNEDAWALVLEAMRYHLFYKCSSPSDKAMWSGIQFKERCIPRH